MSTERRGPACKHLVAVNRAFTDRQREAVADHLEGCELCAAEWKSLEVLAGAARRTRRVELGAGAKAELRHQLLAEARATAARSPRRRRRVKQVAGLAVAAACLTAAALAALRWPAGVELAPAIGAPPPPAAAPPREEVADPALADLGSGDRVYAAVEPAPAAPPESPAGKQRRGRPPPPHHAATERRSAAPLRPAPSPSEIAFREGWVALRNGDPLAASRSFAAVAPSSPLGQDAAFWRGVALARAARTAEAAAALEGFLNAFPTSPHRDEALVTLGVTLHRLGDDARAAEKLRAARASPSRVVRERAARWLETVQPSD